MQCILLTINCIQFSDSGSSTQTRGGGGGGGAIPCVGGYQVPVNRPPFFTQILHPMTPFFIQSTPNDPLFSTFVPNLHKNCKFLHASRAF